jgi:hypothetical protein
MSKYLITLFCMVLVSASAIAAPPFEPAPPVDKAKAPSAAKEQYGYDRFDRGADCCVECRKLAREVADLRAMVAALADDLAALRKASAPAAPKSPYGPGVQPGARAYEKSPVDGLLYYIDREPRAPKYQMVPVLVK